MRRTLPLVITMITGFLVIFRDIFDIPDYAAWVNTYIITSVTLSGATAVAIGCISLVRLHINRIMRKREGWYNSVILVGCVFWFLIMGFMFDAGHNAPVYNYFYQMLPVQLGNMTFALICFYIASSSYRAFRMRSIESSLLLISATLVMLGGISAGFAMWDQFPEIKAWIMNNLNTGAVRGLQIGVTMGGIAQACRNLFGIERGYMAE